jgi:hypothetical protein
VALLFVYIIHTCVWIFSTLDYLSFFGVAWGMQVLLFANIIAWLLFRDPTFSFKENLILALKSSIYGSVLVLGAW